MPSSLSIRIGQPTRRLGHPRKKEFSLPGKSLGYGSYSQVRKVQWKTKKGPSSWIALKIVDLRGDEEIFGEGGGGLEERERVGEVVMKSDSKNVVKIFDLFKTPRYLYCMLELANGGSLMDYVSTTRYFDEHTTRQLIRDLLEGLRYLHSHKVVHRDIKLENLLLTEKPLKSMLVSAPGADSKREQPVKLRNEKEKQSEMRLLVSDFGLAKICEECAEGVMIGDKIPVTELKSIAGSTSYIAPEVYLNKYNFKCDVWSAGVVAYVLLSGSFPFKSVKGEELLEEAKEVKFPEDRWANISSDAKNFIRALLTYQPEKRPSTEEALRLPWLNPSVPDFSSEREEKTEPPTTSASDASSSGIGSAPTPPPPSGSEPEPLQH